MGRARPRSHMTRHTGASVLPGAPFLSEQTLNRQLQSQAPPARQGLWPNSHSYPLHAETEESLPCWSSPLCSPGPQSRPLQTNPREAHTQRLSLCQRTT